MAARIPSEQSGSTSTPSAVPHYFISYRRNDREGKFLAHMIFRDLRSRYGNEGVFIDVDSRSPGLPFPDKIQRALDRTSAVFVIIGADWLKALNEKKAGERDWVRYEVAESLKRKGLLVVPVCISGVSIPSASDLPDDLRDLAWRDGVSLDPFQDFDSHLNRLLGDIERLRAPPSHSEESFREYAPSSPNSATLGTDGFLTIGAIRRIVASSGLAAGDRVRKELLIFQTKQQRTWLVATTESVFVLLDDEDTRSEDTVLQTQFKKRATLPLTFDSHGKKSGVVKFSAQDTWWIYSTALFPDPSRLTAAVEVLIS